MKLVDWIFWISVIFWFGLGFLVFLVFELPRMLTHTLKAAQKFREKKEYFLGQIGLLAIYLLPVIIVVICQLFKVH